MTEAKRPRLWVRVVEAHATRSWVAVILASCAGVSLIMLTAAGMWNTVANPGVTDLAPNYSSVITATLGVLIGSLATYVGTAPRPDKSDPPADDELVLDVEHDDPPKPEET